MIHYNLMDFKVGNPPFPELIALKFLGTQQEMVCLFTSLSILITSQNQLNSFLILNDKTFNYEVF